MGLIFNGNGDVIKAVDGSLTVEGLDLGGGSNIVAGVGTFSGNLNVGGVLTYEDVKNVDSVGIVTAREGVFIPDTKKLEVGNAAGSGDLKIHHTSGNTFIENGTGTLKIRGATIELSNPSAAQMLQANSTAAVNLYFNGNKKFETTNTGVTVTGNISLPSGNLYVSDSNKLMIGTSDDIQIWHDGTNNVLRGITGQTWLQSDALYLSSTTGQEQYLSGVVNGAVSLFYDNVKKLETTSSGVTVTGTVVSTGLDVNGSSTFGANGSITSGANFTLNGNALTVTGTSTVVGEFKGATIPTIQITQTTNSTDLQLRANATGGLVRTATNKPLVLGTNQLERLRITSAGGVHIGNTFSAHSEGDDLVVGGAGWRGMTIYGEGGGGVIQFADDADNRVGQILYNHGNNSMLFRTNGNQDRFIIPSTGGITVQQGDDNYPTTFIGGSSGGRNFVSVKAGNTTSGHNSGFKLYHSDGNGVVSMFINHNDDHGHIMNEHQGGDILFYTNQSGSALEKLRITSTGRLGINYSTPTAKLSLGTGTDAIKMLLYDNSAAANEKYGFGIQASELRQFFPSNSARFSLGTISSSDGSTFAEKIRLESSGILKLVQGATQTNTLQAYTAEGAYAYHYSARTTSGSDRYRRMFDIASVGDSTHGSAIRFMTSEDGASAAIERMRIMHGGGVVVQDDGSLTHNANYPHRECPGLVTVQNGSGESNRAVASSAGVYPAPTGGFVNYADYELATKLINISNSNCNLVMAKNGEPIYINDSRDSWSYYSKLPNYLVGLPCTDCINNSNFTLTLAADMLVFLLRNNGWNGIGSGSNGFSSGWTLIETDTNIGPANSNTRLYVKSTTMNTWSNWDNDSAMYFFRLA